MKKSVFSFNTLVGIALYVAVVAGLYGCKSIVVVEKPTGADRDSLRLPRQEFSTPMPGKKSLNLRALKSSRKASPATQADILGERYGPGGGY